jgi:YbbR domain-containing protein
LAIASDIPERVHLMIRGLGRRLTPEALSEAEVVLDLSSIQSGERTFTINDSNIRGLPFGITFARAVPSQVVLHFDHVITKDVPIEPSYANSPPDGYMVMNYTFEPPKVRIRGADGRAQSIDHVTTDPIDLSGVVSKAERRVHIRIGDPQMRLESAPVVKFTVELGKIHKDEK